ncbi:hypothetical protein B0T19DRAFT_79272 [Cercophora scortea]|uniref:TauD/TfdA-like domain-containing protein n=1 Tax=Cercophora scortea TaxID=314031 RepID=A0AAE0J622_9PEZI|nr:hypothetical protein B0T19DRAFT_79272 [Cercophora scortea]
MQPQWSVWPSGTELLTMEVLHPRLSQWGGPFSCPSDPILDTPVVASKDIDNPSEDDRLAAFPADVASPLCWTGAAVLPKDYVVTLSSEDIESIRSSIGHFKKLGLAIPMISPETFPLPQPLAQRLRDISNEIHEGRGFVVLRGWDPSTHTDEENVIAFCGVASHVGVKRHTDAKGISLDHLRDASRDPKPAGREHVELHPGKVMAPLKFHADRRFADIVGLFVKTKALVGGKQRLSSFWTVFNEMRRNNPDALRVLAGDFPWPDVFDTDSDSDNDPTPTPAPVIFHKNGKVICQLEYRVFEGTNNTLTQAQWKALDTLESIADKHSLELDVQPGDMQLINNYAILHGRRAWVDRGERERHYYRVGLHDPENAWERPDGYERVFDGFLKAVPREQSIPVTDWDPYGMTSIDMGHG